MATKHRNSAIQLKTTCLCSLRFSLRSYRYKSASVQFHGATRLLPIGKSVLHSERYTGCPVSIHRWIRLNIALLMLMYAELTGQRLEYIKDAWTPWHLSPVTLLASNCRQKRSRRSTFQDNVWQSNLLHGWPGSEEPFPHESARPATSPCKFSRVLNSQRFELHPNELTDSCRGRTSE